MSYIGVDLGTSSIKLLLMGEDGKIKRIAVQEYPLYFPKPGWAEQNPMDWYEAFCNALKRLLTDYDHSDIEGISFSGQMHGLVMLDKRDQIIRPAILWNDGRTQEECDYLNQTVGREKLSQYTANMALTGFTAPKLLWVKKNEPENFDRIAKVMLPKDYLAYRLSGVHCTDVSDASGMLLLDVRKKCWSEPMLNIVGLKKEQMAEIYESYQIVGEIKPEIASQFGLKDTVKIIAGGGDQAVAAIGTGTVGNGKCNISLGTSGVIFLSSQKFIMDSNNFLHSFAHADGHYHLMGVILSAAASNEWWMKILKTKDYQAEQKGIKELGKNPVFFLPYLMGERTPHHNPNARGTFIGMTMDTTREEMTQAVLEGVAFALRDSLEILRSLEIPLTSTRINGGGAKSKLWCSIVSNVLGIQVDRINSEEGPAFGAAILAAVGCGRYSSVEQACQDLIQVTDIIEPEKEIVDRYERQYQKFIKLYPALQDIYKELVKT